MMEPLETRAVPAVIVVTSLADNTTADGLVTLREAIEAANSDTSVDGSTQGSGNDIIDFAPSLTSGGSASIDLSIVGDNTAGPSDFGITSNITIEGPTGPNGITINGGNSNRLFFVSGVGSLTLDSLTLTGGQAKGGNGGSGIKGGGGGAGLGGAIFNEGTLTLMDSTLSGNTAVGGNGGAHVSGVSAGGGGGGLGGDGSNAGTSTGGNGGGPNPGVGGSGGGVGGSSGGFGGGGGGGGSGYAGGGSGGFGGGGAGNGNNGFGGRGGFGGGGAYYGGAAGFGGGGGNGSAGGGGAGMGGAIFNQAGTVNIVNSTFQGNTAQGGTGAGSGKGLGGAIFSRNGSLSILNSTISSNTAAQGGQGVYQLADGAASSASINNSILGQSTTTATDFTGQAINSGTPTSSGVGNLIRTNTGFGGTIVSNADPLLGTIAGNGGPTMTMLPGSGSPVLDAGDNAAASSLTTDQRGSRRVANQTVDIGAVEVTSPYFTSGSAATFTVGDAGTFTISTGGLPIGTLSTTSTLPSGVTFVDNGDGTATLSGTPAAGTANSYILNIKASNGNLPDTTQTFTLTVDSAIAVNPATLPTLTVGVDESHQINASGGSGTGYTFTATGLPSGLTLSAAGLLSGTPTTVNGSPYAVVVSVTDSNGATGTFDFSLNVVPALATHLVITASPSALIAGAPLTLTITAVNVLGNVDTTYAGTAQLNDTVASDVLPSSVALVNGLATLTVTPDSAGTRTFTVTSSKLAGMTINVNVTAMAHGTVFLDINADGVLDNGEAGLAGRIVALDTNHDGIYENGEPTAIAAADGSFAFPGVAQGSVPIIDAAGLNSSLRYVVPQSETLADGSVTLGLTPYSPVAPVPVVPNPFMATPSNDPNTAYVQSLFRAVLGRDGSTAEVQNWVGQMSGGTTREQVATKFYNAPEHRWNEVKEFYQAFLHRPADSTAQTWVDDLLNGASEETVAMGILTSPEALAANASNNAAYVTGLYADILGRTPDAGGLADFERQLASGGSRQSIVSAMINSAEAIDQVLQGFYSAFLHRAVDPTASHWKGLLSSGDSATDVAVGIFSSDEFYKDAGKSSSTAQSITAATAVATEVIDRTLEASDAFVPQRNRRFLALH